MRVPFSWLREFVDAPLSAAEVAEKLTLSGIEVEQVQQVGLFDPRVVVGEIGALEPVAKAPAGTHRLTVLADRARAVISNAGGLAVGKKVAVALPGATLFGPDGSLVEVEATELYGARSEGMVVHAQNLGIGDDAASPVEVPSGSPAGAALADVLPPPPSVRADTVLWLSILPNIARCQAMLGVAREVSALLDVPLRPRPEPPELAATEVVSTSIQAPDAASVLTATLIEDVRVTESPEWLRRRLVLAGMTPINNVVDASNYVMLELGQPTHPYDADRLPRLELGVRRARAGERLLTLQQPEGAEPMALPEGVPVITSNDEPVAIAGVLGGRPTSIDGSTRRVLLESAAFDYVAIRKSQRIAKVFSEASARFSRGVNPELPVLAARRFVELLRETSPGLRVRGFGETSLGVPPERHISLTAAEIEGSLGTPVPLELAAEYLRRVGLKVTPEPDAARLIVTVGNARADITLPCDLVEEIARVRGYENVPETLPLEPIPEPRHDDNRPREALRDALVGAGLQEIISYSLNGPDVEARLFAGHPAKREQAPTPVPVVNPVSVERSVLRTSLLPALLQTAALNLRHTSACRLFEIGPVFFLSLEPVPEEREHVGILLAGLIHPPTLHEKEPRSVDFFDLKAIVSSLAESAGLGGAFEVVPADEPPYRPGAAARLLVRGEVAGTLGAVHPRVLEAFDLDGHATVVAELSLSALLSASQRRRQYREYDRLPSIEVDIAMVVARDVLASSVRRTVTDAAGPLLRAVEVFDQFISPQFGDDKKGLAVRLRLNGGERTLEMSEALEVRSRVARALEASLAAQIRE